MPRSARVAPGGTVFHVLNRGVGRIKLFRKDGGHQAFETIVEETLVKQPMRICSYLLIVALVETVAACVGESSESRVGRLAVTSST